MIKFQDQVPSVYPSASRDFQYLCWLINIVLNSVKHNVDDIYDLPNSKMDARFTELLAMTLGFKVKRNYDQNQLRALVAALPRILKYKGTKAAVDMAGRALIAASGAVGNCSSRVENGTLIVPLPVNLVDISLFTDLLVYILPAGMTYRIERENKVEPDISTKLAYRDALLAAGVLDLDWDEDTQTSKGLSSLFDPGSSKPVFTNYLDYTNYTDNTPNIGLLDNNIIAMIDKPLITKTSNASLASNEIDNKET